MFTLSTEILRNPLAQFRQFEVIEAPRIDRHKQCKIDIEVYYEGKTTKESRYYITQVLK